MRKATSTISSCLLMLAALSVSSTLLRAAESRGPFTVDSEIVSDIPVSDDIVFEGNAEYPRPAQNAAAIYFPVNGGAVAEGPFPLIVYGHGMRASGACPGSPDDNRLDYTRLSAILDHLASWGFIVISVDLSWLTPNAGNTYTIPDRMFLLRDAMDYMIAENYRDGSPFNNRIRTVRIGLMGHSMGADASVLLGASDLPAEAIGAVAAVAPPNHDHDSGSYGVSSFAPRPVLVMQGTNDIWHALSDPTGAEVLYSDAGSKKHLLTITDANHFGYTDDICVTSGDFPEIMPRADQQNVARAYLTAFFRRYLRAECNPVLHDYLTDTPIPGLEGFGIELLHDAGDVSCNQTPTCNADGPYLAECAESVILDGSGSTDADGDPLQYSWFGSFAGEMAMTRSPTVEFTEAGVFSVDLDVSDGLDSDSCSASVTVEDTRPPTITAPADLTVECTSPDGAVLTRSDLGIPAATDTCDASLDITTEPSFPASLGLGSTSVIWRALDDAALEDTDVQIVTVADTVPPEISVSVIPEILWPPNHKLVLITPTITVADTCDPMPAVSLTSVTMNETDATSTFDPGFDSTVGDGRTSNDIQVDDSGNIYLRAERSGSGSGRIYTITYTATDASGRSSTATATVEVPHNQ